MRDILSLRDVALRTRLCFAVDTCQAGFCTATGTAPEPTAFEASVELVAPRSPGQCIRAGLTPPWKALATLMIINASKA
jgi:hypothetical protein